MTKLGMEKKDTDHQNIVIPEDDLPGGVRADDPPSPWPGLPPFDSDSSGVNHSAPPIGYWSEWTPADCTHVNDLDLSDYADTDEYLRIFVTAMDEAGAVLPPGLFGAHYNLGRNWIKVRIEGSDGS